MFQSVNRRSLLLAIRSSRIGLAKCTYTRTILPIQPTLETSTPRRSYSTPPPTKYEVHALLRNATRGGRANTVLAAPVLLVPFFAAFKSLGLLSVTTLLIRAGVVIIAPWRYLASKRKLKSQLEPNEESSTAADAKAAVTWVTFLLLIPPSLLLGTVLGSLEYTPVSGRLRIMVLSKEEEEGLISEYFDGSDPVDPDATVIPGRFAWLRGKSTGERKAQSVAGLAEGSEVARGPRDWGAVLRKIFSDSGPEGYLGGKRIVDGKKDWRVGWVESVLRRMEDGANRLTGESEGILADAVDGLRQSVPGKGVSSPRSPLVVPPLLYPLQPRRDDVEDLGSSMKGRGGLLTNYGVLVVESPEVNAMTVGFGPGRGSKGTELGDSVSETEEGPGVLVVYTGLLDEILSGRTQASRANSTSGLYPSRPDDTDLPWFLLPFSALSSKQLSPRRSTAIPTEEHTNELAVILSHELAHLMLSHYVESISNRVLYQQVREMLVDVCRTILYPFTSFMGPVVNDWIGNLFTVSTTVTMNLVDNCGSRSKEIEADLLGLRLLAYAGWDPRLARDFWSGGPLNRYEERLKEAGVENQVSFIGGTHPVHAARLKAVEEELARWEGLGKLQTIVA